MTEELIKLPAALAGIYVFMRIIGFLDLTEKLIPKYKNHDPFITDFDIAMKKWNERMKKERIKDTVWCVGVILLLPFYKIYYYSIFELNLCNIISIPYYVCLFFYDMLLNFLPHRKPVKSFGNNIIDVSKRNRCSFGSQKVKREYLGIPIRRTFYSSNGSEMLYITMKYSAKGIHWRGYNSVVIDSYRKIEKVKNDRYEYKDTWEIIRSNDKIIVLHNNLPYDSLTEQYLDSVGATLDGQFRDYVNFISQKHLGNNFYFF